LRRSSYDGAATAAAAAALGALGLEALGALADLPDDLPEDLLDLPDLPDDFPDVALVDVGAGAAGAADWGAALGAGWAAGAAVVSAAAGFAATLSAGGGGDWAFEAPGERTESDATAAVKAATRRSFATNWITRHSFRLDVARSGDPRCAWVP